jgi:microcin C transport system substrate-binding protein
MPRFFQRSMPFLCAAFTFVATPSFAVEKKSKSATVSALAMRAKPKYGKNFTHFEFANPNAPKGGTLTLASQDAFDTLNPFGSKGTTTAMITFANIFETLMTSSLDEPFSQYGLLAETVEVGSDGLSVTFNLNPKAQWSDGKPVTADDVLFSYEILTSEKSKPFYRSYYADVKSIQKTGERRVTFTFKQKNAELHMILGQLPVLPKHFYGEGDFNKDFVRKVMGSGPYVIKDFEFNKIVRAERNPNYWGRDLAVNKGRFNFDAIVLKSFKNADVMLMGLKSGDFDFQSIASSKQWAVDVTGDRFDKQCLVKNLLTHKQTQGMQGFAFNIRRQQFQDRRVRKALALALDFNWMNSTLFYKQYSPHASYFDNSDLAARGLPSSDELKLLNPLKGKIPDEVFTQEPQPFNKSSNSEKREHLIQAKKLLEEAGWTVRNGGLEKDGKKFEFTILMDDPSWQRIVEPYLKSLRTLGIAAQTRVEDQSIYIQKVKRFDFDMIVENFPQSESPGNEQRDMWHSTSADTPDSRNIIGIKDAAIDALVDAVIRASTRPDLVTATHALDRVLWFNHYMVPHWYMSAYRTAYWNRFSLPKTLPLQFGPTTYFTEFAWVDAAKEQALINNKCK